MLTITELRSVPPVRPARIGFHDLLGPTAADVPRAERAGLMTKQDPAGLFWGMPVACLGWALVKMFLAAGFSSSVRVPAA